MRSNRRDFLKWTGMMGAASLFTLPKVSAGEATGAALPKGAAACVLIPGETAGPFPLDLTANTAFFRKDIRESKTGAPLNLKLKILALADCAPMQNVRVNVWHCDKDGKYSGYDNNMNPGQAGLTYLRGYQMSDAAGEVEFTTVFPGWYNGRICHIHFQVHVSSSYAAVSQLTFDIAAKNAIFAANPMLYAKGADPTALKDDNVFSDGYAYQVATLTANADTGGYDAYLEVTVNGSGSAGLGHQEAQNAKQFKLGQSYPNPYSGPVAIPFALNQASDVVMEIWSLSGKRLKSIPQPGLAAGEHTLRLDPASIGLRPDSYLYQIEVANDSGTFRQYKLMTAARR